MRIPDSRTYVLEGRQVLPTQDWAPDAATVAELSPLVAETLRRSAAPRTPGSSWTPSARAPGRGTRSSRGHARPLTPSSRTCCACGRSSRLLAWTTSRLAKRSCSRRSGSRTGSRRATASPSAWGAAGSETSCRCSPRLPARSGAAGGEPYLVPCMGSHGGATADGQAAVLAELGVTEASVGAPVVSTMDAVEVGAQPLRRAGLGVTRPPRRRRRHPRQPHQAAHGLQRTDRERHRQDAGDRRRQAPRRRRGAPPVRAPRVLRGDRGVRDRCSSTACRCSSASR